METKHTKGPWKIGLNPGPMIYTLGGVSQIADARGVAVTRDESKANARLIAAAPELLEALIKLAAGYRELTGNDPELMTEPAFSEYQDALNAIANAT